MLYVSSHFLVLFRSLINQKFTPLFCHLGPIYFSVSGLGLEKQVIVDLLKEEGYPQQRIQSAINTWEQRRDRGTGYCTT
jgi:hypothetical protein